MTGPFFSIEMLPAKHGDALWVEYGDGQRTRRIVIDGGPLHAFPAFQQRFHDLPTDDQRVELLVITHVDTDHIEGIIRLLAVERTRWPFLPMDIWFNGYHHMADENTLGGREGEFLSALLQRRADEEWNKAFNHKAIVVDKDRLPVVQLAGGMKLTLLSPDTGKLKKMRQNWEKGIKEWKMDPGDLEGAWKSLVEDNKFHPGAELTLGPADLSAKLLEQLKGIDSSTANGSSIAFLAEYGGKSCLFLGDAHMSVVCASLRRLLQPGKGPLQVDAVKMSHHGSHNNLTRGFLELIDAKHFLFSTNGDKFKHPDHSAVEAVITGARSQATLWFNYRSPYTTPWESDSLKPGAGFSTRYPEAGQEGIKIAL
ncbi:MAG: hypothetical protein DM484_27045 [Candidatus Methylumidiphilus alinenensis]|uniref:Metallo-beta-lactamase domain-containing protein n=1 Tax=Candidatus Methylumidiphilus alinenensis TaxID=2202197 RepID=A0A2W4QIU2_9GAMM|nr:MAG: hypothetical protein DM484_27045 [Candidatus Methylumidiphilus alinenensis]